VEVTLTDLLTQDQVPVDCELLVFFQLDLRRSSEHFRAQALHIPEEGWHSVIRNVLQETISEVVGGVGFQHLLTPVGRGHLKRTLGASLAARVQRLGLIVDPQTGISVQVLKPAQVIWQAMVDRLAAVSLGEAARARIYPMLEELSQRHPEIGLEALFLEWAAVIAKDGAIPQVLMAPTRGVTHPVLAGLDQQAPIGRSNAGSVAGDGHGDQEAAMAWMGARVK
jgi:hypothetical protein